MRADHDCAPHDIDVSAAPSRYRCTVCGRTWRATFHGGRPTGFDVAPRPPLRSRFGRTA